MNWVRSKKNGEKNHKIDGGYTLFMVTENRRIFIQNFMFIHFSHAADVWWPTFFSGWRQTGCWFFILSPSVDGAKRDIASGMNKNEIFHFIQHISSDEDMCVSFAYILHLCEDFGKHFFPCDVFSMKSKILSTVWKCACEKPPKDIENNIYFIHALHTIRIRIFEYGFSIVLHSFRRVEKMENEFCSFRH